MSYLFSLALSSILSRDLVDCVSFQNPDQLSVCEVILVETVTSRERLYIVCERGSEACLVMLPSQYLQFTDKHLKNL